MKRFIALLSVFALCLLFVVPVNAASSYIKDLDITCQIDEKGTATITETIDISAHQGTEYYQIFSNMHDMKITLKSVVDEEGRSFKNIGTWDTDASREEKAYKYGIVNNGDYYELCFGIGEYGEHVFTMTYEITHFVLQYKDTQGVNFAFISEMKLRINEMHVKVTGVNELNKETAKIWAFGYRGTVLFEDGAVVMQTEESINGGKMQLLMQFVDGSYSDPCYYHSEKSFEDVLTDAKKGSEYRKDKTDWFGILVLVMIVGMIAMAIFAIVMAVLKGNEERSAIFEDNRSFDKENVHFFRDIPCHKNILMFYFIADQLRLIEDDARANLLSAYILRWVQKDQTRFETYDKKGLLRTKKEFKLDMTKTLTSDDDVERELYSILRSAAGADSVLESKEFKRYCQRNYERIEDWGNSAKSHAERYLIDNGYRRDVVTKEKGLIFTHSVVKHIYTPEYREEMEHVYGFKQFLKDQDNMNEKEVIDVKLWDEYLIFASILGIADEVEKQIKVVCPQYYESYYYDPYYVGMSTRSMCHSGSSAASSAASAGEGGGSSFGGGGGGFSGGGGGGLR